MNSIIPTVMIAGSMLIPSVYGAQMGALGYRFGVHEGNYTTPYATSGTAVAHAGAGQNWSCYGSASAGAAAARATSSYPNAGSPRGIYVRGQSYWFEQFVITAPGVPTGTLGEARFKLYFDGGLACPQPIPGGTGQAGIFYRVSATIGDGGQPNLSGSYDGDIRYYEKEASGLVGGGDFTTAPQEHVILFRFGELTNLTIFLKASTYRWTAETYGVNAELRFRGWNGFDSVKVQGAGADLATFSAASTTGLDMAVPTTSTFDVWRTLYNLTGPMAEPDADPNQNGMSNRIEYALGLDPLASGRWGGPTGGTVLHGGSPHLSLSYTRPKSGKPGDLSYVVQRANGLASGSWSSQPADVAEVSVVPGPGHLETVTVRSTTPVTNNGSQFMRLALVPTQP